MKNIFSRSLLLSSLVFSLTASAQVYLDVEADPVPLFDLTVIIPQGTAGPDAKQAANYAVLQSMMEAGTMKHKREDFLDQLAEYGASFSFAMGGQYSTWSLNFPYQEGKDYQKLVQLLQENWDSPRLTPEEFQRYRQMSLNNLKSSLNNDPQVALNTVKRWVAKKTLGLSPLFIEPLNKTNLKEIRDLYQKFKKQDLLWAGFVGPDSMKPLVKDVIGKVFKLSDFREEKYLKTLPTKSPSQFHKANPQKQLLILAKPNRTQNVTAMYAVAPERLKPSQELNFLIGDHVTVGGGLGSLYGEALRTKGGFSYSVASLASANYLGYPVLGFYSNPMSSKQDAAMATISRLIQDTFQNNGKAFTDIPAQDWDTRVTSYRYEKVFAQMTPDARLSERQSVVIGFSSPELYHSDPLNWNARASDVGAFYKNYWDNANIVMAILGDPKELTGVAAKHFPGFKVKVIPYTESVSAKTFD